MKPHAKTALSLALAIVGGIAAGMRCDASVTVETPTQINPRPAAYTVKAYTEGSAPFVPLTGQAWAESPDEKTADAFAADMLLPASCNREVAALNSLAEVRRFADDHDLSPGIVVGRYRHITQRFNAFGNSIARFTWSEGMWRVA